MISFQPFRDYLKAHNITLNKACRDIGFAERIQVIIKHDRGNISLRTVEKLCLHFNIPVEQVLEYIP